MVKSKREFKSEEQERQERIYYYSECRKALQNTSEGILEVDGRTVVLSEEIASGGFKSIFDIGDGKVIALRNTNDGTSDVCLMDWEEGVGFELKMSQRLQNLGLYTQDYQRVDVKINGHAIPALMMSHFQSWLAKKIEIRGSSSNDKFGTSMLFGTIDNLKSESYFRLLFKPLIKDIIILISNRVNLNIDSFEGLAIVDSHKTSDAKECCVEAVVDQKKEVHLFLMDFYQKRRLFQLGDLKISDSMFRPDMIEIERIARFYLSMALLSLISAMTEVESSQLQDKLECNLSEFMDDMCEKMKASLLEEICHGVCAELSQQKLSQFDTASKLTRSVSSHSFFYVEKPDEKDSELTLESLLADVTEEDLASNLLSLRYSSN